MDTAPFFLRHKNNVKAEEPKEGTSDYLCRTAERSHHASEHLGEGWTAELKRKKMETEHKEITIASMQEQVDQWIKTYGVRYFSELTNMTVLMEEVGELARVMARTYGDQSFKAGENGGKEKLAEEMADVLWVLTCLANQTGVDLTEAFEKTIEKKTNRDKTRHLNNPKLQ